MLAPMFDFDFCKAAIVPEATRVYRIRELGVELDVVGLNPTNPDYWSEVVGGRIARADDTLPAAERAVAAVAARAPIVARHAIRGWRGVVNTRGEAVPYSPEAAVELVRKLTEQPLVHLYYRLSAFVEDADNFTGAAHAHARALAGNSSGG